MKPVLRASAHFDWVQGSDDPAVAHRLAHDTAWALLDRVRHVADPDLVERVIAVADTEALDDIAELWSDASANSLAGMLWRLYLIRQVVRNDREQTTHTFRLGFERAKTIDPVVVGVAAPAQPEAMSALADEILRGVFAADLSDALVRASAFANIMSLGCTVVAQDRELTDEVHAREMTQRALRYSVFAGDFAAGAKLWHSGSLR
jgi:hypothetical protein